MKKLLPLLFILLILTLALVGPEAPADDPTPAEGAPQTSEAQPAGEPPSGGPPAGGPAETFVPSEKLPADSAISFPVDI